jgi:hypothetical protein
MRPTSGHVRHSPTPEAAARRFPADFDESQGTTLSDARDRRRRLRAALSGCTSRRESGEALPGREAQGISQVVACGARQRSGCHLELFPQISSKTWGRLETRLQAEGGGRAAPHRPAQVGRRLEEHYRAGRCNAPRRRWRRNAPHCVPVEQGITTLCDVKRPVPGWPGRENKRPVPGWPGRENKRARTRETGLAHQYGRQQKVAGCWQHRYGTGAAMPAQPSSQSTSTSR